MRGWLYAIAAASVVLVGCDRVFGLNDTVVITADDTPIGDAHDPTDGSDGAGSVCDDTCMTVIAADEINAGEIDYYIGPQNAPHLVWTINAPSGAIHTCALPGCQVMPLVNSVENSPVDLSHDGDNAYWIVGGSNGSLKKASLAGTQQIAAPACANIAKMRSYVNVDGIYSVTFDGKLVFSPWSTTMKACQMTAVTLSSAPLTSALTAGPGPGGATMKFAYVGFDDHVGAYSAAATSTLPLSDAQRLVASPRFLVASNSAGNQISACPLDGPCDQLVTLTVAGTVLSLTVDPAGNVYAAVTQISPDSVEILRVATPNAFGPIQTIVTGLPPITDFVADGTGFYATSEHKIVRIALP